MSGIRRILLAMLLVDAIAPSPGGAQTIDFLGREVRIAAVVTGAPYSADAETTVRQILADGTRIERRVEARLYRDGSGRVRREQTILGLAALDPSRESHDVITISDPVAGMTYTLDPATRTARRTALDRRSRGDAPPPPPPPPPPPAGTPAVGSPPPPPPPPPRALDVPLGTREVHGLRATGTRSTLTIPAGRVGNDRPLTVVSERWESADLRLLLLSVHDDPRSGRVEFRLSNVRRAEPPADLFTVPSGYTVVDARPGPTTPSPR
jgi:hypothetical protein